MNGALVSWRQPATGLSNLGMRWDQPPSPLSAMRVAVRVTLGFSRRGCWWQQNVMILPSFKYTHYVMACDGQPFLSHTSAAAPVWLVRVLVWVTCCRQSVQIDDLLACLFVGGDSEVKIWKTDKSECCLSGVLCFIENIIWCLMGWLNYTRIFLNKKKEKNEFWSFI